MNINMLTFFPVTGNSVKENAASELYSRNKIRHSVHRKSKKLKMPESKRILLAMRCLIDSNEIG